MYKSSRVAWGKTADGRNSGVHSHGIIPIYCGQPHRLTRLRQLLRDVAPSIAVDCWNGYESAVGRYPSSVLCVDHLALLELRPRLQALMALHPEHAILLVTDPAPEALRAVVGLPFASVAWFREIETTLASEVRNLDKQHFLDWMTEEVNDNTNLPPLLRSAFLHALRSSKPVMSVSMLATDLGRDRRTLWRHWADAFDGNPPFSLKQVLWWIALVHAVKLKRPGRGWNWVATQMGTSSPALSRWCKGLLGVNLREFALIGMSCVTGAPIASAIADLLLM